MKTLFQRPLPIDLDLTLSQHVAAWNDRDRPTRLRHLCASWSPDGEFRDGGVLVVGRTAMNDHIEHCHSHHPDGRFVLTSAPARHLQRWHFTWALRDLHGHDVLAGVDFAELDECGRVWRLWAYRLPAGRGAGACRGSERS